MRSSARTAALSILAAVAVLGITPAAPTSTTTLDSRLSATTTVLAKPKVTVVPLKPRSDDLDGHDLQRW